jgi:hypothetical protein
MLHPESLKTRQEILISVAALSTLFEVRYHTSPDNVIRNLSGRLLSSKVDQGNAHLTNPDLCFLLLACDELGSSSLATLGQSKSPNAPR